MIGLVFHFEDWNKNVYSGRVPGCVDIWRHTAKNFGANLLVMVDQTTDGLGESYQHTDTGITFERYLSLEEAEAAHPDLSWVYFEVNGDLSIDYLDHPVDNAVYVFGPDSGSLPERDNTVKIHSQGDLWSICAATVALYDRSKQWPQL